MRLHRFLKMALVGWVCAVALGMTPSESRAQSVEVRPYTGLVFYLGDWEKQLFSPASFGVEGKFPYAFGAEVAVPVAAGLWLGVAYHQGNYPTITRFVTDFSGGIETATHPTVRHTFALALRHPLTQTRVRPYARLGVHGTVGRTAIFGNVACVRDGNCPSERRVGGGTLFGGGVAYALGPRVGLFAEAVVHIVFPDGAADGDLSGRGLDVLGAVVVGTSVRVW